MINILFLVTQLNELKRSMFFASKLTPSDLDYPIRNAGLLREVLHNKKDVRIPGLE